MYQLRLVEDPTIVFFGERNKVLYYDIKKNSWDLYKLDDSSGVEFHYYSSAVTLVTGEVLITGGGLFKDVYLFSPKDCKVEVKKSMNLIKKEHSTVYLNGKVYAIGGYDGQRTEFLNQCEVYDIEADTWEMVSPMNVAKCAFAATKLGENNIFVCGGYDGDFRVDIMELYDDRNNTWTIIEATLPVKLSNSACSSVFDNEVIILGGGSDYGFSKDVFKFDLSSKNIEVITQMDTGRDLRNKVVLVNNELYCIGGQDQSAEKYSIPKAKWIPLKSYQDYNTDTLCSWSCALVYEKPKKSLKPSSAEFNISNLQNIGGGFPRVNHFGDYSARNRMFERQSDYHNTLNGLRGIRNYQDEWLSEGDDDDSDDFDMPY